MHDSVSIAFLGDIYFGESPSITLNNDVKRILGKADLVMGNLEGPLTQHNEAVGGGCCIKSAIESANILKSWNVNIVSLANNHMFDYGWAGFENTCHKLDEAGVAYLGAGKDLSMATKPMILEVKGLKIGLLSYSGHLAQTGSAIEGVMLRAFMSACDWYENLSKTVCATEKSFGCASLSEKLMKKEIRKLASMVDIVIVLTHWGYCGFTFPSLDQVVLGNSLIDAGATAVVGHHSHVVQGVQSRDNALVAYSLGNFAFADYVDLGRPVKIRGKNREGIILFLHLTQSKEASYDVNYIVMKKGVVELDNSQHRTKEFSKLSALIESPEHYSKFWRRLVWERMIKIILYRLNPLNLRKIRWETFNAGWLMLRSIIDR